MSGKNRLQMQRTPVAGKQIELLRMSDINQRIQDAFAKGVEVGQERANAQWKQVTQIAGDRIHEMYMRRDEYRALLSHINGVVSMAQNVPENVRGLALKAALDGAAGDLAAIYTEWALMLDYYSIPMSAEIAEAHDNYLIGIQQALNYGNDAYLFELATQWGDLYRLIGEVRGDVKTGRPEVFDVGEAQRLLLRLWDELPDYRDAADAGNKIYRLLDAKSDRDPVEEIAYELIKWTSPKQGERVERNSASRGSYLRSIKHRASGYANKQVVS